MPYTTPARYCDEVGHDEARAQLLDDGRVLTAELLRQVVAVEAGVAPWPPETTTPEKDVATAAHERLVRKLDSVCNFMDGYLRAAVTLPLSASDQNIGTLETCCLALLREELANDADMSTELIVKRADRWRKWLVDVASKTVALVGQDGTSPAGSSRVVHGQAKSSIDWGRFPGA